MRPADVTWRYRKNLAQFLQWEKREALRQEDLMSGYRYKILAEVRVPDWIGVLAVSRS